MWSEIGSASSGGAPSASNKELTIRRIVASLNMSSGNNRLGKPMKRVIAVLLWAAALVQIASAVTTPIACNIFFASNSVSIGWNAYPGKSYVLQTTTNLARPWQGSGTLTATSNSIFQSFPISGTAQFFKVVKLDTDGPEVYKTSPFDGAIGVGSQANIQAWLR